MGNVAVAIPASESEIIRIWCSGKYFMTRRSCSPLYNALNHSHYEDPELLHITTLENAVYLSLQNDLSFVVDFDLWFLSISPPLNPNMPYRFFIVSGK